MKHEKLNELLRDFLIQQREKAGLSQGDVAARSEVFGMGKTLDQRAVSRIEQQPIAVDAIKIAGYLSAVGVSPLQYYELLTELTYKEDEGIMLIDQRDGIATKIEQAKLRIAYAKSQLLDFDHEYIKSINLIDSFDQIDGLLSDLNRKPVIGFFGHFDAGKSTLINTVINQSLLPTKYQPATCVVNLLMHIDDRPATISGSVALFRKGFKPHMVHDQMSVSQYLIEQGGQDILDRLGVHNHDSDIPNDAYIAVVFSSSEVLRKVWLLDTPGDLNSSDESDTEKALGGVELADGIVFISNHTGFFKESDLGFASNIIRQRPPVEKNRPIDHLLFVQSHCHSEISSEDAANVGKVTFKRIKKQLDNLIFNTWHEDEHIDDLPSSEDLTSRVQPFWRENDVYRANTMRRIHEMSDFLIDHHEEIVDSNITRALSRLCSIIDRTISEFEQKKAATSDRIREVEQQDARFREQSAQLVADFNALIDSCADRKDSDIESMGNFFRQKTSPEGIAALIEETYTDKKEAQSEVGNYISQLLAAKLESTLKTSGKLMSFEIDELLGRWQKAVPAMTKAKIDADLDDMVFDVTAFNSRAAFIGGLAGIGSLGAMALYVSTIVSNLGAYILVGKAAGVLVSLGLVGSVTSVTSFVAAIGGPITIGIALAAAIGYLIYRLVGDSWQLSLAKKLAEAIKKEDVWDKIESIIDNFWVSTAKAVKAGLQELIAQTNDYISQLKQDAATEYDLPELDKCIGVLGMINRRLQQVADTKVA